MILEVKALSAGYGKKTILHDVSFSLEPGTMTGLLGSNGSGKTTLLKSLCGLLPHTGQVTLQGMPLKQLSPRALARRCSLICQRSGISIDISALDVVLMGFNARLGLLEYPGKQMKESARQALEAVGLGGMEEQNYQTLSEGQKQLCILARTLVGEAALLMMDEPESALDFFGRYQMLGQVKQFLGADRAALVTLHDPQLALNCCDRLLLLRDGCLLDALEPQRDSLEDMERKLSLVYGDLTLLRVNSKDGKPQLVLVR